MARPTSALDLPLHTDLGVLAQCRRELLRQAHASTSPARRLPVPRRTEGCHQPLRRRHKRQPQTLRLDRRSQPRPCCCQTRETSVRVGPLGTDEDGFYLYRQILHPDLPNLVFIGRTSTFINILTYCLQARRLAELIAG